MATFVLVHGAWHGGWCWKHTARALRAAGHEVFTPTLSGNGERVHQNSHEITLETHVRDVVGVFDAEEITDAILVGHSYGGMVITAAADRLADRIRRLVYLDAFVPAHGQSLIDCIRAGMPDEAVQIYMAHFHGSSADDHSMMVQPLPGALFGATPETDAWMQRHCNPQALHTFAMPVLLNGQGAHLAKTYILADGWDPSPFGHHYASTEGQPNWTHEKMSGGHGLMMDQPLALAEVLARAAG